MPSPDFNEREQKIQQIALEQRQLQIEKRAWENLLDTAEIRRDKYKTLPPELRVVFASLDKKFLKQIEVLYGAWRAGLIMRNDDHAERLRRLERGQNDGN